MYGNLSITWLFWYWAILGELFPVDWGISSPDSLDCRVSDPQANTSSYLYSFSSESIKYVFTFIRNNTLKWVWSFCFNTLWLIFNCSFHISLMGNKILVRLWILIFIRRTAKDLWPVGSTDRREREWTV